MGISSSGSSPTTASCAGRAPSRRAALRSACSDGLPTTSTRHPVMLRIIAVIAREVPSALPPVVAKKTDWEQLYRRAPCHTASHAASSASMENSRYQPASTASTWLPGAGGTTSMPACRSGPARPSLPSAITRRWPRRVNSSAALTAGVSTEPSFRSNPASASAWAYPRAVFVVPLVNATNGRPRAVSQRVMATAPGRGVKALLRRSVSTSVPSRSKTNPRADRSRSLTVVGTARSGQGASPGMGGLRPGLAELQPEAGLADGDVGEPGPRAQLAQQAENARDVRVVVAARWPGGEHRVHFGGRHDCPEQQLLVAGPRKAGAKLGQTGRRRLGHQLFCPGEGHDPVGDAGIDRPRGPAERAEDIADHLVGHGGVAAAADHVVHGLRAHDLRERSDHDRVT